MRKVEFDERVPSLRVGQLLRLVCRGNYGDYAVKGKLEKIEDGRVYLDIGMAHHYSRIISIHSKEGSG